MDTSSNFVLELLTNGYIKEIFFGPLYNVVLWVYVFQLLFYNALNIFFSINPLNWFSNYVENLKTWQFYIRAVLLFVVSVLFAFEGTKKFLPNNKNYSTRFQHLVYAFTSFVGHCIFCPLVSALIGFAFIITKYCTINEAHTPFFLLVSCWTIAFIYLPRTNIFLIRYNIFQPLHLNKVFPTLLDMFRLVSISLRDSLKIYLPFIFVYSVLSINLSALSDATASIYTALNGWLLVILIVSTKSMLNFALDFYFLQFKHFSVNIKIERSIYSELDYAIDSNIPLIRYLGYYDLWMMSRNKPKVKDLFHITQPGYEPVAWERISSVIISFINNTTEELKGNGKTVNVIRRLYTSHRNIFNFRNLCNGPILKNSTVPNGENNSKMKMFLFKFKLVAYLFEELPEAHYINIIQEHSQCLSIACRSLSNIASASLSEDSYGIVQNKLPEIIRSLIQLRIQLNAAESKMRNKNIDSQTKLLNHLLTDSVKSSLYKLALTFGPYVQSLNLSMDDERYFENFINFSEV